VSTVYLLVGPPGAGKTTFVSWELVGKGRVRPTDVLSPDGLLYADGRYEWTRERVGRAWAEVRGDYEALLATGRDLVLDATFVRRQDRRPWLELAREAGHRVVAVFVSVPSEVLVERDRAREEHGKRVGVTVIHRFWKALEPPELGEGFDEVWVVGEDGGVLDVHK